VRPITRVNAEILNSSNRHFLNHLFQNRYDEFDRLDDFEQQRYVEQPRPQPRRKSAEAPVRRLKVSKPEPVQQREQVEQPYRRVRKADQV
jgi:hypothetical protein